MPNQSQEPIDLKRWMEDRFTFDIEDSDAFVRFLKELIAAGRYTLEQEEDSADRYAVTAYQDRRSLRDIFSSSPNFIESKRHKLEAVVEKKRPLGFYLRITPLMESNYFPREEEFGGLSQGPIDRVTDDIAAADEFRSIVERLHKRFNLPLPAETEAFFRRSPTKDAFIGGLFYALDGYRSRRLFYSAPKGVGWNWPAFLLPEFWFIWHEIMGIGFAILLGEGLFLINLDRGKTWHFVAFFVLVAAVHIGSGLLADRIHYHRYGCFPGELDREEKDGARAIRVSALLTLVVAGAVAWKTNALVAMFFLPAFALLFGTAYASMLWLNKRRRKKRSDMTGVAPGHSPEPAGSPDDPAPG